MTPKPRPARHAGGLAPRQARLARDLLLADLETDPSLPELAAACGLSVRHFSRAFRASFGAPPHQWVLQQRVARARDLLLRSGAPLSDIALACGFADQSHLTRVFHAAVGASPAAWRRERDAGAPTP